MSVPSSWNPPRNASTSHILEFERGLTYYRSDARLCISLEEQWTPQVEDREIVEIRLACSDTLHRVLADVDPFQSAAWSGLFSEVTQ